MRAVPRGVPAGMSEPKAHHERLVYPRRRRVGRSASNQRSTTSGFTWLPPEQVPGAVLPPEVQRRLQERLDAIDQAQARARVSGASYVIYR